MASTFDSQEQRISRQDALDYHSGGRRGKIEVVTTKVSVTVCRFHFNDAIAHIKN